MKQRGFTIIEMVIAVTLAAFLLAAVAPSVSTWMRNTRIRTAAEAISNGLQQARNEAVRRLRRRERARSARRRRPVGRACPSPGAG